MMLMLRVVGWRRVFLGRGGCGRNHGTVAVAQGDKDKEGVGPGLHDFMRKAQPPSLVNPNYVQVPYLTNDITQYPKNGRIYFETYGCQMNFNDLEIVLAIMKKAGFNEIVEKPEEADVIFINTCAIRENAEHRVWHRLNYFKHVKSEWTRKFVANSLRQSGPPKVAVLGCMAERLKRKLLEANKMVDVICGPDAYRDLPRLLANVDEGQAGVNTLLSLEETYADVSPVRISKNSISAFVSIMRGCNNMCSYCIVPFTRGRERSRPLVSIVREVGELVEGGVKEVTLLGQNVNSYNDLSGSFINKNSSSSLSLSPGFSSICKNKESGLSFTHLLDVLSDQFPEMRFRFTSPHPKDFPDELLLLMRDRPNICNSIHLPAQSGSSRILENMRRGYTREAYLSLVDRIRTVLPDSSLSSDFITGFCGETEEDHADTLSLVEKVEYDMAYMFAYSMREKTHAHRHYEDDVPEEVKQRRLMELITTFRRTTVPRFNSQLGTKQLVLVSGVNKRDSKELIGLSDKGHRVVFPILPLPYFDNFSQLNEGEKNSCSSSLYIDGDSISKSNSMTPPKLGDYVAVHITETTTASLKGNPLARTNLTAFMKNH